MNTRFHRQLLMRILSLCTVILLVFSSFGGALAQDPGLPFGYHDEAEGIVGADGCYALGWVYDPDDPVRDLQVQILADGAPITVTTADLYRPDVVACTGGTCGFYVNLWGLVTPDVEQQITAQSYDDETQAWVDLFATPKPLTCQTPPAIFVVNTTDDFDDGWCDEGHCSLREAINASNASPAADTVIFNIPGETPFSIQLQSGLPNIDDPVVLDATTQPGFAGTPIIELDGSNAGMDVSGLAILAGSSTVKGLVINRFSSHGIVMVENGGNTIQGNYIGTDWTGTTVFGPAGPEVGEYSVTSEVACPTYPAETDFDGFVSETNEPLAPWNGQSVTFVGTDECGSPEMFGAASLIYRYKLESTEDTQLNLIAVSGAAFNGPDSVLRVLDVDMNVVGMANTYGGNSFQTPYIRLQGVVGKEFYIEEYDTSSTWRFRQSIVINGPVPLGNYGNGVLLANGTSNNLVAENVLSGNLWNGIGIFNAGTTGNIVQDNKIGTDLTGTQALGNAAPGVGIGDLASDNWIIGNLISGNQADGIALFNTGTNGNVLQGNKIGTDASGESALPNNGPGLWIGEGASDTLIGGAGEGEGNLISGNNGDGISINHAGTTGTLIQGNRVSTNALGNAALSNLSNGVILTSGTSDNQITGNLISGNRADGIAIFDSGTTGNTIQGNKIGTDWTGTTVFGPAGPAVGEYTVTALPETCPVYPVGTDFDGFVSESEDPLAPWSETSVTFVGTDECTDREKFGEASLVYRYKLEFTEDTQLNLIAVSGAAFNGPDSVLRVLDVDMNVVGMANTYGGNSFQTPYIRLQGVVGKEFYIEEYDTSSTWRFRQSIVINGPVPLGNYGNGVLLANGASNNLVDGNVLSGNLGNGVVIFSFETTGNTVQDNYIGTDLTGAQALGNAGPGVGIFDQASDNWIIGNLISGNRSDGVMIANPGTNGNVLQGNKIGTDASGAAALSNNGVGIWIGEGASNTLIGGAGEGEGNLISGNAVHGISLNHLETTGTILLGNKIGTNQVGDASLPNLAGGVFVSATLTQVGGTEPGEDNLISGNENFGVGFYEGASENTVQGNTIALNSGAGIAVNTGAGLGNTFSANAVFSNGWLGIDLNEDGVTFNDLRDQDTGPNNLQNFPILGDPVQFFGSYSVAGALRSQPNSTYRIEFFSVATCDISGYGEGDTYLGFMNVTIGPSGLGLFVFQLGSDFSPEAFVTATATDSAGNTSEFSRCVGPAKQVGRIYR